MGEVMEPEVATLRDQFAMAALQGMLAANRGAVMGSDINKATEHAYTLANAMLKARKTA